MFVELIALAVCQEATKKKPSVSFDPDGFQRTLVSVELVWVVWMGWLELVESAAIILQG